MKHLAVPGAILMAVSVVAAAEKGNFSAGKAIAMPEVRGRIDHFAQDAQGRRLFVAGLGNNTVEVLDVAAGTRLTTIRGCSTPQGVAYVPGANRLVIANGGSGVVTILDGTTFQTLTSIADLPDADNVRYDAATDLIYVGYGDGALAVIGGRTGAPVATIPLPAHPEAFQLEKNGKRLYVNLPEARQVAVVDCDRRAVVATWSMTGYGANFPMALDEANHRLFVGCRNPARLVVLDTADGKEVSAVEISGDTDDVYYDARRRRIYISCGAGFLDVVEQRDADSYVLHARMATVRGARTGFFSPETGEFYLGVPARENSGSAEVRVFSVEAAPAEDADLPTKPRTD